MSPDTHCIHCDTPVMYSEKSRAWLGFVWCGGELTAICRVGGKHAA